MPWWFVIMANWELKKTNISFGYCWQLIILYLQKVQEIWYSQKKVNNIQRNLQIIYYKGFGNKWILNIKNNENVIVLLNDQETLYFQQKYWYTKQTFKLLKLQFVYQ